MVLCCFGQRGSKAPPSSSRGQSTADVEDGDPTQASVLLTTKTFGRQSASMVPALYPTTSGHAQVSEWSRSSGAAALLSGGALLPPWLTGGPSSLVTTKYLSTDSAVSKSSHAISLSLAARGFDSRGQDIRGGSEALRTNLNEMKALLQKLALVSTEPNIALNESAELLCKHLSVSMCSITGYTDSCTSFALLAVYGVGSTEVEKMPVMRGANWSAARLLHQHAPACLCFSVDSLEAADKLPTDLQALYHASGLRSFLSVPVSTDQAVIGCLTMALEAVDAFDVDWWEPLLGCLTTALLVHLRSEQSQHLCQLMRSMDSAGDYVQLLHRLLTGAQHLLLLATNIKTGCRLALLGADGSRAIVFEADGKAASAPGDMMGRDGGSQVHVTEIAMENTLLLDAVAKSKARFVSDCASYIQSCMKPATDVFISGQELVASIVVLPLIDSSGTAFGGFYITLETSSNFQNIKDLLVGLVSSVVLVLQKRLQPQRTLIWDAIVNRFNAVAPPALLSHSGAAVMMTGSGSGPLCAPHCQPVVVKRSGTEAMLKVLQHEVRKTLAKQQRLEWIEELVLCEVVGKGGFGIVYRGMWKGSVAAVKVMFARQHERQAMKVALEMAVLTTVSHPNIIQVYQCFTDMVEEASGNSSMDDGSIAVRFRRLQHDEDQSLATCNILVMEYCDRSSLRTALKKGSFHKRLSNTSVAVDLCSIVKVLIEVAQAIQHLHSMRLIHCDIKPENVLLKSDGSSASGMVTKLSDFGLAKLLRDNVYVVNRSGSGTVTHLAPELFLVGSKLTTSVDTFSFGILMWELYTGQRAYGGLGRDAIIERVYKRKARPPFPPGVPHMYISLAKACWDNEPGLRPAFAVVLLRCAEMLAAFQDAARGGRGHSSAGPPRVHSSLTPTTLTGVAPLTDVHGSC